MHNTFFRCAAVVVGVASFVVAVHACGGTSSSVTGAGDGGDAGPGPGDGSPGGGDGGLSAACPVGAPANQTACDKQGLECEYGNDPALSCDVSATCSGGSWQVSIPAGAPTCPTMLPATCPASREAIPQGGNCATANLQCTYATGECVCRQDCGPRFPVPMQCEAGTPLTWSCGTPAAGCPVTRPHLGATCTTAGLDCSYAEEPCTDRSFICEDGTWHAKQNQCPVSSATKKNEIHYLSDAELRQVSVDTLGLRLTTYRYKDGDPAQHLGFIIEDAPQSHAVLQGKGRIDLYGYTSMAVATLQMQQRELDELRREVADLKARNASSCGSSLAK